MTDMPLHDRLWFQLGYDDIGRQARMANSDIPSPVDFHDHNQALAWEAHTIASRPWRPQFFTAFAAALTAHFPQGFSLLELGSGPGHLAEKLLADCAVTRYAALDFSPAMHALARARLGAASERVQFITSDFRDADWGVGVFDAIVTMQAAHEVRHIRHIPALFANVRRHLAPGGLFLYCDHYCQPGDGKNPELMLAASAQPLALEAAGFSGIVKLLDEGGMALYAARPAGLQRHYDYHFLISEQ